MFEKVLIAGEEMKPWQPLLAAAMSVTRPRTTRVTLLSVRERPYSEPDPETGVIHPTAADGCEKAAAELRRAGYQARPAIRLAPPGEVADTIVRVIDEVGPELVVIGSRGLNDLQALMAGSVSHRVLAEAGCPVLVVRDEAHIDAPRRLLVAFDDSHHSRRAARVAAELARSTGAEIEVLVVTRPVLSDAVLLVDNDNSQRVVDELIDTICGDLVANGTVRVSAAGKAACIAEEAEAADADLIVMGTRGLSRIAGAAIGSVSHEVIHLSHRQVLLVP